MRRLLVAALCLGAIAGGVAAAAIPESTTRREPPRPLRYAPERAPGRSGERRWVPRRETVRIELRRADPAGGPDWAVRTFSAGHRSCVQLGRIARGRFGWIDATNTFRPVGPRLDGAPISCGPDAKVPPRLDVVTLIGDIDRPSAHLTRTVAWGAGGPGTRAVDVKLGSRTAGARVSRRGAFVEFASPDVTRALVSATFHYADGRTRTASAVKAPRGIIGRTGFRARRDPVQIEARAPDPNGGLPWGLGIVRRGAGTLCTTLESRIVGERMGMVDYTLGTLDQAAPQETCWRPGDPQLAKRAVQVSYSLGGSAMPVPGDDPAYGRVARRTLQGITSIGGVAHESVTALTIATPRDVRTLIPSKRAHAFLAVYDGEFPTGAIVITAHFRNGTSRVVDRFEMGSL
jgi:hypothetical protein